MTLAGLLLLPGRIPTVTALEDDVRQDLEQALRIHGWPCSAVEHYRPLADDRFKVRCAGGRRYRMMLRPGWDLGPKERQTGLRSLLDVALASSAAPRAHGRVVQITSAMPKDGKSSLVACLARAMAIGGAPVVAVDCDLRQSTLDGAFGLDRGEGVVEFLAGRAELDDIVQKDPQSAARVIAAGGAAEDPLRLLRTPRFAELLRRLRERYTIVLVDSPPVLAVADARLIAPLVDDCVLVVRWLHTRREAVQLGREQLVGPGGRVAGAVLTQVKGHGVAGYGYDGGYGYRR